MVKGPALPLAQPEHDEIRSTLISPGAFATELGHDITDPAVATALTGWRKKSLTPDASAHAVRYALEQSKGVDINEAIIRRPRRTCGGAPCQSDVHPETGTRAAGTTGGVPP